MNEESGVPEPEVRLLTLSPELLTYTPTALLRVQSRHPSLELLLVGNDVLVRACSDKNLGSLRKELSYAIYREKIYTETLSMRRGLIELVRQ